MQYQCTYKYCGRLLPRIAIEPKLGEHGWTFVCPVCAHESKLIDEADSGLPDRFVQPDQIEHVRDS